MKVKDLMTQDVDFIKPDTFLKEAAIKMRDMNVGVLPVGSKDGLLGILTDRDITIRAAAEGRDPSKTKVKDVMTREVAVVREESDIHEAANIMEEKQIRRLLVIDRNEKICGIISLGDIAVERDKNLTGEILKKVSEPSEPNR